MKAIDYINSLIKERDELKELCKQHVETIHSLNREVSKLNAVNLKQNKKIQKLETTSIDTKVKDGLNKKDKEFVDLKNKYNDLQSKYEDLQSKYDIVVNENIELKRIFDDIDNECDSD